MYKVCVQVVVLHTAAGTPPSLFYATLHLARGTRDVFHSLPPLVAPCARYAGGGSICLANGAKRVGRVWSAKALSLFVCCLNGQG